MNKRLSVFNKLSQLIVLGVLCMLFSRQVIAVPFEDSFESGGTSHSQNGYKWNTNNSVSSDIARTGNYSLKFTFDGVPSGKDSFDEVRFQLGKNQSHLYMEYYMYFPDGTEGIGPKYVHRKDTGPNNNKFFRVWDDDYNSFNVKYGFSMHPTSDGSKITPECAKDGGANGKNGMTSTGSFGNAQLGRWMHIKIHIATDTGNGAVVELWRDGVKIIDDKVSNIPKTNNYFRNGYILGWANSGFDKTTNIYVDDVKISDQPISNDGVAAPKPPTI